MPSLGFMPWKAPGVELGEYVITIRRVWKRPIKVGDTLHLFEGLRTKACRRLGVGRCTRVRSIWIYSPWRVKLAGKRAGFAEVAWLAHNDGFADYIKFYQFFTKQYGLPFEGVLIEWEPLEAKSHG